MEDAESVKPVSITLSGRQEIEQFDKKQEKTQSLQIPEWFMAEAFVKSGMFKGIGSVYKAFTKIMAGKELGLGPFTSMRALHVLPDGVEMHYTLIGALIKKSGKYDFEIATVTDTEVVINFYAIPSPVNPVGRLIGTSRFTIEDAKKQKLVKADSAWEKTPRNMLTARAMSNGAKWFCPDAIMMPLYAVNELESQDVIDAEAMEMLTDAHESMKRPPWLIDMIADIAAKVMPYQGDVVREVAVDYSVTDEALCDMIDRLAQANGLGGMFTATWKAQHLTETEQEDA